MAFALLTGACGPASDQRSEDSASEELSSEQVSSEQVSSEFSAPLNTGMPHLAVAPRGSVLLSYLSTAEEETALRVATLTTRGDGVE